LLNRSASRFADFVRQLRQELQDVGDDSDIGHLEERSFRVFVDGDDEGIAFNPGEVLELAADAAGHVHLGLDGLSG